MLARRWLVSSIGHLRRYHEFAKFREDKIWEALKGPLTTTDYANAIFYLNRNAGITFASGRLDPCFENLLSSMTDLENNDLVRLFAVACRSRPKEQYWNELCKYTLACQTFSPTNLAHLLQNFAQIQNPAFDFSRKAPRAKMALQEQNIVEKVLREARDKTHLFTGKDIVIFMVSLVQLGLESETEELITQLCVEARVMAPELTSEQIALTLKILALIELYDEALVEALCKETLQRASTFNVPQITLVFESLRKFGVYHQEMIGKLFMQVSVHCSQMTPPVVVKTLQAMLDFDMVNIKIVKQILKGANAVATRFTASEIAETFRLLIEIEHYNVVLCKRLLQEAGLKAANFRTDELASIIFSMSKFGLVEEDVLQRLLKKASERISEFTPAQIADLLTALSVLPLRDEKFAAQLCDQGLTLTNEFTPVDADRVVKAIARLERASETKSVLNAYVVKEKEK